MFTQWIGHDLDFGPCILKGYLLSELGMTLTGAYLKGSLLSELSMTLILTRAWLYRNQIFYLGGLLIRAYLYVHGQYKQVERFLGMQILILLH